jgi:hypothetical protein
MAATYSYFLWIGTGTRKYNEMNLWIVKYILKLNAYVTSLDLINTYIAIYTRT